MSAVCSINDKLRGGEGWPVEPLGEDFISDVMIAGEMDAEDFDEALGDAEIKQNDARRRAQSFTGI